MKRSKRSAALLIVLAFLISAIVPTFGLASGSGDQGQTNSWYKKGEFRTRTYLWNSDSASDIQTGAPYGPVWTCTTDAAGAVHAATVGDKELTPIYTSDLQVLHAEFESPEYANATGVAGTDASYGCDNPTKIEWKWSNTAPGNDIAGWWSNSNTKAITSSPDIVSGSYPEAVPKTTISGWLENPNDDQKKAFGEKWQATWQAWASGSALPSSGITDGLTGAPEVDKALAWVFPMSAVYSNLLLTPDTTKDWTPDADGNVYVAVRANNGNDKYSYYTATINAGLLKKPLETLSGTAGSEVQVNLAWTTAPANPSGYTATAVGTSAPGLSFGTGTPNGISGSLTIPSDAEIGTTYKYSVQPTTTGTSSQNAGLPIDIEVSVVAAKPGAVRIKLYPGAEVTTLKSDQLTLTAQSNVSTNSSEEKWETVGDSTGTWRCTTSTGATSSGGITSSNRNNPVLKPGMLNAGTYTYTFTPSASASRSSGVQSAQATVTVTQTEYTLTGSINNGTSAPSPTATWTVGTEKPVLNVQVSEETADPTYAWQCGTTPLSGQMGSELNLADVPNIDNILGSSGSVTFTCTASMPGVVFTPSTVTFTINVSMPAAGTIAVSAEQSVVNWTIGTPMPSLSVVATNSQGDTTDAGLSYKWSGPDDAAIPDAQNGSSSLTLTSTTLPSEAGTYTYSCVVSSANQTLAPAGGKVTFTVVAQDPSAGAIALKADQPTQSWEVGTTKPTLVVQATPATSGLKYTWTGPDNKVISGQNAASLNLETLATASDLLGTKRAPKTFTCTVSSSDSAVQFVPNSKVQFIVNVQPPEQGKITLIPEVASLDWTVGTNRPSLTVLALNGEGDPVTHGLTYEWTGPGDVSIANQSSTLNLQTLPNAAELLGEETLPKKFTCKVTSTDVAELKPEDGVVEFTVNVSELPPGTIALAADKPQQNWTVGAPRPTLTVEWTADGDGTPALSYQWYDPSGSLIPNQNEASLNLAQLSNGAELLGSEPAPQTFVCQVKSNNGVAMVPSNGTVSFTINVQEGAAGTVQLAPQLAEIDWTEGTSLPSLTVLATSFLGTPVHSNLTYTWTGPDNKILAGQNSATLDLATVQNAYTLLGDKKATKTFSCKVTATNGVQLSPNSSVAFKVNVIPLPVGTIALSANRPVITWTTGGTLPTLTVDAYISQPAGNADTSSLTYTWAGPDGIIDDQDGASLNLNNVSGAAQLLGTQQAAKTFTCTVTTSSGAGLAPADGVVSFIINVMPYTSGNEPEEPTVTLTVSPKQVTVNQPVEAEAVLNGWSSPTVEWSASGCGDPQPKEDGTDPNGSKVTFTPTAAGTLTIKVEVSEGGTTATETTTVTVIAETEPSPSPSAPDQPTNYPSAVPSGSPSTAPSGSPSAAPSGSASPSSSATPAPLVPNPAAPNVSVTTTPGVAGEVITGIPISTNATVFPVREIGAFVEAPEGTTITVLQADRQPAAPSQPISTGQIIRVASSSGATISEATIIVAGDVLGTGEINIAQLVRLAKACIGEVTLSGPYRAAGDFSNNGRIDIGDVVREARMFV